MDIIATINALLASLADLQAKLADASAALVIEKKLSYDEGFAAGVASVQAGDPAKVFTQADLDAAVLAGVAKFKADFLLKFKDLEDAEGKLLKDTEALLA